MRAFAAAASVSVAGRVGAQATDASAKETTTSRIDGLVREARGSAGGSKVKARVPSAGCRVPIGSVGIAPGTAASALGSSPTGLLCQKELFGCAPLPCRFQGE